MIVLDTNVISEMLRAQPNPRVTEWLAAQPMASLFTASLVQAEILYGIAILPRGRRQVRLASVVAPIFEDDLRGRVLPFDAAAASHFAEIAAARRRKGRPISQIDAQIAAITRSRGAKLATRNIPDFADCGVELIDPWK